MESTGSEKKIYGFIKKDIIIVLLLIFSTSIVYFQVSTHQFVNFDDQDYVAENPHVKQGITLKSVRWALGFPDNAYWAPVTFISHMIDVQFFGLNAGKHHLVNLFYHIVNSLLLFVALRYMTGAHWRSAFVAGLFALHPMNVDSVAWIAERKNLVSTTFWLLTMILYFFYTKKPDLIKYIVLVVVFTIGLMAKQMLVTLPFVLLLMDYWPLRRISFACAHSSKTDKKVPALNFSGVPISRLVVEKIPMFALSLGAIIVASLSIKQIGIEVTSTAVPICLRLENAVVSYVAYICKMIFPHALTFFYPYPDVIPVWQTIGSAMFLLLVTAVAMRFLFSAPYLAVGWFWFLGTIVPVSGIMQGGLWPAIAERWAYVPYIGLFIAISWGFSDLFRTWNIKPVVCMISVAVVLVVLAFLSWRQAGVWKDDFTLFSHGVKVNPKNYVAQVNLGRYFSKNNKYQEAISHVQEALKVRRNDLMALGSLAEIYKKIGDKSRAIYYYSKIISYYPDNEPAYYALGEIYTDIGQLNRAYDKFSMAVRLNPKDVDAYYNLGVLSAKAGATEKAVRQLENALNIQPGHIESHVALGIILMNEGKRNEAIAHFSEVLKLNPNHQEAKGYLVLAQNSEDKIGETLKNRERKEGEVDPGTLYKAVVTFSSHGEYEKALDALFRLRDMQPDNPNVYYNIACIYAKQKKVDESLDWLNRSIKKGFIDWKLITSDKDLDNIRDSAGYRKLIARRSYL